MSTRPAVVAPPDRPAPRRPSPARRHALLTVADDLRPRRKPAGLLAAATVLCLVSAAFHLGVWLVDGGPWMGPLSWRKPIVFSLSIGVLAWTMGWLLDRLPDRRVLAWSIAGTYAVAGAVELGLIVTQTWRGEASHFNTATATDAAIFAAMGVAVGFISLAILALAVWSIVERPDDPVVRAAAYWGLALVVAGLGLGQWIITLGTEYVSRFGEVPTTVVNGEAGVATFPHAIALHGIQLFIVAGALIRACGLDPVRARRAMRTITWSYAGVAVFAVAQTILGHAPTDLSTVAALAGAGCAAVLATALSVLIAGLARTGSGPDQQPAVAPVSG